MKARWRWPIVGAVLAAGFAVVVFLSAWNTDVSGPGARGPGTGARTPGPMQTPGTDDKSGHGSMPGMEMPGTGGGSDRASTAAMTPLAADADGLKTTAAGLTLAPTTTRLAAGRATEWRFTIRDAAGRPVTRFERDQTKLLHLILVRRDLTDYQHLHPGSAATASSRSRSPWRARAATVRSRTSRPRASAMCSASTSELPAALRTDRYPP